MVGVIDISLLLLCDFLDVGLLVFEVGRKNRVFCATALFECKLVHCCGEKKSINQYLNDGEKNNGYEQLSVLEEFSHLRNGLSGTCSERLVRNSRDIEVFIR
jgi:hypothetical protein